MNWKRKIKWMTKYYVKITQNIIWLAAEGKIKKTVKLCLFARNPKYEIQCLKYLWSRVPNKTGKPKNQINYILVNSNLDFEQNERTTQSAGIFGYHQFFSVSETQFYFFGVTFLRTTVWWQVFESIPSEIRSISSRIYVLQII